MQDTQGDVFQQRLARIAQSQPEPGSQVSALPDWRSNIGYPAKIVGVFLLGMLAVIVARWARYHVAGGTLAGEDADITMMIDGALGVGVGFIFANFMKMSGAEFKSAQAAGVTVAVLGMHNLVHWAPPAFDVLFSPEWRADVETYTEANSILFRGTSFVLIEPKTGTTSASGTESITPRLIELDNAEE